MASLPPRQASHPRASPEQSSSESQRQRSQSRARSSISEDSQTVLLETPSPVEDTEPAPIQAFPPRVEEEDVRKCWICYADETEDTSDSSAWRSPCPCALTAHEDCLLDWVADLETSRSKKRELGKPQILCPQCKSPIALARHVDPIVETVKAMERVAANLVTPAIMTIAMSSVVHASTWHGINSIFAVFGVEDGARILQPLDTIPTSFQAAYEDLISHWRLHVGLPLIAPMLMLARTNVTNVADTILPVLPIVFFATQGDADQPLGFASWPPSASLTMAVLPYLRGVYSAYLEGVWGAHERRWIREIRPRSGTSDDQPQEGAVEAEDDGNNLEVMIDGGIWQDWNEGPGNDLEDVIPPEQPRMVEVVEDEQAPALEEPPLADNHPAVNNAQDLPRRPQRRRQGQAGGRDERPAQAAAPAQAQAQGNPLDTRFKVNTTAIIEKMLGALLFPHVAALSGNLLGRLLPSSWTTKPGSGRATGLLQERWGRSIVGGCLFVVFKDAIVLYVWWKMAQQHRKRKVLDFHGKRGKAGGLRT